MKLFECYCDYGPAICPCVPPHVLIPAEDQVEATEKFFSMLPEEPRAEVDSFAVKEITKVEQLIGIVMQHGEYERLFSMTDQDELTDFWAEELKDFL